MSFYGKLFEELNCYYKEHFSWDCSCEWYACYSPIKTNLQRNTFQKWGKNKEKRVKIVEFNMLIFFKQLPFFKTEKKKN